MNTKEILTGVTAVVLSALALFGLRSALSGTAAANRVAEQQAMMARLLPDSETFTPESYTGEDENITGVWRGESGYVVETTVAGYAGEIRLWVGVSDRGRVTGLVVRDMAETFGLGREALTDVDYLAQYLDTDGGVAVGENVDAITGATVTSRAITRGVNSAAAFVTGADVGTSATEWGA